METLSHREILDLNTAIGELYSIGQTGQFHRNVMAIVGKVLSFDRASYNKVGSGFKLQRVIHGNDDEQANADVMRDVHQEHVHEHPFWKFKRGVKTISEMTDQHHFRKTGLYNEYYRKLGTESQILSGLGTYEVYAFSRGARDFSDREKLILTLLQPHLVNAFRNNLEKGRFMEEIDLLRITAEAEERGTILLTSEGRVKWISRRARYWLMEYSGSPLKEENRLPNNLAQWARREMLSPLLTTERKPLIIRQMALHPDGIEKRLVINLVRGPKHFQQEHPQSRQVLADGSGFMLILREESSFVPETCGLTPRETEVLQWIAEGKTNGSIAIILGISVRTVEKHLERIFEKLGVETRAAAAAIVLGN